MVKTNKILNNFLNEQGISVTPKIDEVVDTDLETTFLNFYPSAKVLIYFNGIDELYSKLNKKIGFLEDEHKLLVSFDEDNLKNQFKEYVALTDKVEDILENTLNYINSQSDLKLYFKLTNPRFEIILNKRLDGKTSSCSYSGFLDSYLIRSENESSYSRSNLRTSLFFSRRLITLKNPLYPKMTFNSYRFKSDNSDSSFSDSTLDSVRDSMKDYYLHLDK